MTDTIFLSASVPDPERAPQYAATADTVAITAAVSALVFVALGRRKLVWGGHPAITPMIWAVAEGLDIDYASWVKLYQSLYFEDEFPEENKRFQNVAFTPSIKDSRQQSLALMRGCMFEENSFASGVFIGGMQGIVEEFDMFHAMQPKAAVVPIVSTGGAVLDIAAKLKLPPDLSDDHDYVALMHRYLGVAVTEERYRTPLEQPRAPEDRNWHR